MSFSLSSLCRLHSAVFCSHVSWFFCSPVCHLILDACQQFSYLDARLLSLDSVNYSLVSVVGALISLAFYPRERRTRLVCVTIF